MCTAITYQTEDLYFGRTLDHVRSYGEEITITPRQFPLHFRQEGTLQSHYAIIGMAHVAEGYPLYYDAVNEKGLAMAGLHFVGNAVYHAIQPSRDNIAHFECIPWILSQCATLAEARHLISRMNLTQEPFSPDFPPAQLHWILADRTGALTLESTGEGIRIYDNPVGVLTNNPTFPMQLFALNNYIQLSPREPANRFLPNIPLDIYSLGMGAIGLPGDFSSQSRFIRACFARTHALSGIGEAESVGQCFHILGTVEQPRGCCLTAQGELEITLYTACCNTDKGIYYYTTYGNRQICGVDMHRHDLESSSLLRHPLIQTQQIRMQN